MERANADAGANRAGKCRRGPCWRGLLAAFLLALSCVAIAQVRDEPAALDTDGAARMSIDEARRVLALPLAPGTAREQAIACWTRRQQAAFTTGDGNARIEALRRLVVLTEATDTVSPFAGPLWREPYRNGNPTEALEYGERLVDDRRLTPASRATRRADPWRGDTQRKDSA